MEMIGMIWPKQWLSYQSLTLRPLDFVLETSSIERQLVRIIHLENGLWGRSKTKRSNEEMNLDLEELSL